MKGKYFNYENLGLDIENGTHRTKLKCTVNPFLRLMQFWTNRPFVIYSLVENLEFIRYGFGRIYYER